MTDAPFTSFNLPMIDKANHLRLFLGKDGDVHIWETLCRRRGGNDYTVEEYHETYCELIDDDELGEIYVYRVGNRRKFAIEKYYKINKTYDWYYKNCDVYVPINKVTRYMNMSIPTLNSQNIVNLKLKYDGTVNFNDTNNKYNPNITLLTIDEYHEKYCKYIGS